MEYYSAFLLQLNMEPCFSADTPPLSGIHIKQLPPPPLHGTLSADYHHTFIWHIFFLYHSTFIWHYFLYSSIPPLSVALLLHLSPPLSGTFSSHLTLASAPRRAFLHPPLLVTFTLHLLPYYSTLMWHFPRASPRSIYTHLNMVSFSLFLSRLYMTLILFIITRQYYSPQLLQGFSAEGFSRSFSLSTSLLHIFPWLFFR